MLLLVFLFVILAAVLLWVARGKQKSSGLPSGRVIYSDTSRWMPVQAPLYDPDQRLTGKPDYLVQDGKSIIPVEVKSGEVYESPYDSHIYQLAAYCWLVERTYGERPAYGIIHYRGSKSSNQTFTIPYTPELTASLLSLLSEMRDQDFEEDVSRSHRISARCASCGYRNICDQRID